MRRLGLNTFRHDIVSHLKVLLDCYNIALRMLKIFIRGAPNTLKIDKSKEKLTCLLERMITLSSVCKIFSVEHSDIISSKDFLMDDVDRKCVSLLEYGKRVKLVPRCHEVEDLKCSRHLCAHTEVHTMTSDAEHNYERQVTRRTFKKLADRAFGRKDRSTVTIKKRKSRDKEHGIKNSKDEVYASKEENKTADIQGAHDLPLELEHFDEGNTNIQSCGDNNLRGAVSDLGSRCEIEEETKNLTVDESPEDKEKCDTIDGVHKHLHGAIENSLDKHQMDDSKLQPSDAYSNGVGINKQRTVSTSINNEQQGIPSFDNLIFSEDIKMFNTAGSISDRVMGECLRRVGCEVDNFVEDFVQKMFSLEFT